MNSDPPVSTDLLERVRQTIKADDRTAGLAVKVPDPRDASPYRVALVGPYSAGKSLLVAALLRMSAAEADEISAAKPHTVDITIYPWRQHHLLDLPGTLSGLDEHDDTSRRGVRSADALLIVTTVELPGEDEARAIRQLLDGDGFRGRCVIVINKSASENSDLDVIRTELERRIGTSENVTVTFTDARDFLDALNDPELTEGHRGLLRDDSGIPQLEDALDEVLSQSVAPRRIAQLHEAVRVLDDALAVWQLTTEEEVVDSTASRVEAAITTARTGATEAIERALVTLEDGIRAIGDDLATALDPKTGEIPKADSDEATKVERSHLERFTASVNNGVNDAVAKLATELGAAFEQQKEYARVLRVPKRRLNGEAIEETSTDQMIDALRKRLSEEAGKKLAELVEQGTRPGTPLHDWARKVNKTLNKESKPYVHIHTAEGMAKGLSIASTVLQIVGPAIDASKLLGEMSRRHQINKRADEIRTAYATQAKKLVSTERTNILEHLEAQMAPFVEATAPQREEAAMLRAARDGACSELRRLREEAAVAAHMTEMAGA